MLSMVLLKMAADLGFFLTLAGPFALRFGAGQTTMLAALGGLAVITALSWLLAEKGLWRFLPLLGVGGFWLLEPTAADLLMLLPMAVYAAAVCARRLYCPEWARQKEIFSVFWKVFLVYVAFAWLLRVPGDCVKLAVIMGMITLVCLVLLMRSLRHEMHVYCQLKYQLLNLFLVLFALFFALILSTKAFLNSVFAVLGTVYRAVVGVLMEIFMLLLKALVFLFQWIKFRQNDDREVPEIYMGGAAEIFGLEENTGGDAPILTYILIVLAALAVIFLIYRFFRFLSQRYGEEQNAGNPCDHRVFLPREEADEGAPGLGRGSPVQRVRRQYQRFLRLCLKRGQELRRSQTSGEIQDQTEHIFGQESAALRELYLKARYDHQGTAEDAARAKQLMEQIKKNTAE